MSHPPRLAELLLSSALVPGDRDAVLGDLCEEYSCHRRPEQGSRKAWVWYWRQVLTSLWPLLFDRIANRSRLQKQPLRARSLFMHRILQDVRFGLRTLSRNPGFSLIVILTLALGLGANTTVFSVVDGLVLNPFDFPDGDSLVGVGPVFPKRNQELGFVEVLSPPEYLDLKNESQSLEKVVCWDMGNRQVSHDGPPENTFSGFWWGNPFETLGVTPTLGRGFTEEETLQRAPVAIISHRFWMRRFGGDQSMLGKTLHVNGNPHTLIGVMPPGTLIYGTDLWLPFGTTPERFPRNRRQMQILARLTPGTTLQELNTELEGLARRIEIEHASEFEEYQGWGLIGRSWTTINTHLLQPAGLILLGSVAFVVLLVCANMASFMLARSLRRRQEMAIRAALGAGRGRVVRQLLTESLLLGLVGGTLGVGLAFFGVRLVAPIAASTQFLAAAVAMNERVLACSGLAALAVGLLVGILPALRTSKSDTQRALNAEGQRTTSGIGRLRLQSALVAVEVALAVILLMGGGLLIRSLITLQAVDPGFDAGNVLTMRLTLQWEKYTGAQMTGFFNTLVERTQGIPGVSMAAATSQFPPNVFGRGEFWIEGHEQKEEGRLPTAYTTLATEGYFETLGMRLIRGRTFNTTDLPGTPFVAVINEDVARLYFPGQNPIGQRLKLGGPDSQNPFFEVVGIVNSTKNRRLQAPSQPEMFASIRQAEGWNNQLSLVVRTERDPYSFLDLIRHEVTGLDPDQPVYNIQTIQEAFAARNLQRRLATTTLTVFAVFALILAAVGIFAVISYKAAARTQEIGVRIALGARGSQVRGMVARQAMIPVLVGAVVGLGASFLVGNALSSLLFQVSRTDPLTITAVIVLLLGIAALASYLPARRASRMDPVAALRFE